MKYEDILSKLQVECPFPSVFEEPEKIPGQTVGGCRRKIVHIRADYDGYKWWNTIWPCHDELATMEIRKEIDAVYEALTAEGAFKDLAALTRFCEKHPAAKVNEASADEFNFYFEGELCCYWLRCITRFRDYNLYLHAFLKPAAGGESDE